MTSRDRIILVTGATGFIGGRLMNHLLKKEDIQKRSIVLPQENIPEHWKNKVEVIKGSITSEEVVKKAMENVDTVVHCAAIVGDWGPEKLFWEVTVEGSRNVFEAALKNNTRVILLSSIVVYGTRIHKQECPEETPYGKTIGPYSRTKQAQEKLAWEYHKKGMKLVVVRPANVYGVGSGPWLRDIVNVYRKGLVPVVANKKHNAGLIHVENLVDIILAIIDRENLNGKVYNACDGSDVTWYRYFSDLSRILGKKKPMVVPYGILAPLAIIVENLSRLLKIKERPLITREALNLVGSDNRFPISRAQKELNFTPRVSYEEGIKEIEKYLRNKNRNNSLR